MSKNRFSLLALVGVIFILTNLSYATNNQSKSRLDDVEKIEKLAEYSALNFLSEYIESSTTVFKSSPMMIQLERDHANMPQLTTKAFVNNYSEIITSSFYLNNFISNDANYDLDVDANSDTIYALLTNHDDDIRKQKNVLLKSSDGKEWQLYKSFPAEWELFDLEVNGQYLSVACANCEDVLKISYIISNDYGKTWHKYSLSEDTDVSLFSGMANDNLFVVSKVRNPGNRKELINELTFTNMQTKKSAWKKADIAGLLSISSVVDGKELNFKFDDVEDLYAANNYLIARVSYATLPSEDDGEILSMSTYWISRDNGSTWQSFPLNNLESEEVMQFENHGNKYHLVTSRQLDFPDLDLDNSGLDLLGIILKYIEKQKYSYYTLSNDDLDKTSNFKLVPKHEILNGMGLNIDYKHNQKASYVDAVFLHKTDFDLKLNFYRLHD